MDKKELVYDLLYEMPDYELAEVWNNYCATNYGGDKYIYEMNELDYVLGHCTPTEVLETVADDFSTYDDFFRNSQEDYVLHSFNVVVDNICVEWLADCIIDDDDDFGHYDIRELLDSEEYKLAS